MPEKEYIRLNNGFHDLLDLESHIKAYHTNSFLTLVKQIAFQDRWSKSMFLTLLRLHRYSMTDVINSKILSFKDLDDNLQPVSIESAHGFINDLISKYDYKLNN